MNAIATMPAIVNIEARRFIPSIQLHAHRRWVLFDGLVWGDYFRRGNCCGM